jgi:hypothetical protein
LISLSINIRFKNENSFGGLAVNFHSLMPKVGWGIPRFHF